MDLTAEFAARFKGKPRAPRAIEATQPDEAARREKLEQLQSLGSIGVLPSGPMPFHYDEQGTTVTASHKFGLPLSVSGPSGGWEEPPRGVKLQFVQAERRLPHLPAVFPFPEHGDLRWRPLVRSGLSEGDVFIPLVELRDDQGNHYGHAAAYVEHKVSRPKNAKLLYVWFGLLQSPQAEVLVDDVLAFAAKTRK